MKTTPFVQKKVAKFLMGLVFSREGVFDPKTIDVLRKKVMSFFFYLVVVGFGTDVIFACLALIVDLTIFEMYEYILR